jgi:hypothetical protein
MNRTQKSYQDHLKKLLSYCQSIILFKFGKEIAVYGIDADQSTPPHWLTPIVAKGAGLKYNEKTERIKSDLDTLKLALAPYLPEDPQIPGIEFKGKPVHIVTERA